MTHADFEHSAVTDEARCGFLPLPLRCVVPIAAVSGALMTSFAYCLLRRFDAVNSWDRIVGIAAD